MVNTAVYCRFKVFHKSRNTATVCAGHISKVFRSDDIDTVSGTDKPAPHIQTFNISIIAAICNNARMPLWGFWIFISATANASSSCLAYESTSKRINDCSMKFAVDD